MFENLIKSFIDFEWHAICHKTDFNLVNVQKINPSYIFIPHWSYMIPSEIYENYTCIVFHMTDLPYGRGGSPLQNLIVRKHQNTKISALKVEKEIDAGPIYLKRELDLTGTAQAIFERMNPIIEGMIREIILDKIIPQRQEGEITTFKRRTPEEGNLSQLQSIEEIYDYIRMLDAEGYPSAFLETDYFKFEFTKANPIGENELEAYVRIIKK